MKAQKLLLTKQKNIPVSAIKPLNNQQNTDTIDFTLVTGFSATGTTRRHLRKQRLGAHATPQFVLPPGG